MSGESIWKKEISFGRKPKDQAKDAAAETTDDKPASIWKKELSLKRKPKADAQADDSVQDNDSIEQVPGTVPETGPEQTEWKKEVSFSRKVEAEPVAEERVAEEPVAEEQVPGTVPEPGPEQTEWKKEVSFSRKVEAEPVAEEPVADEQVPGTVPETGPEQAEWKKELSFSRKAEAEPLAEEPVAAEPVSVDPVAEEAVAAEAPATPVVESWTAAPSLPPAPVDEVPVEHLPVPQPAPGIHPPVPAAELAPLPDEEPKKVPFWKKEISLGGGKKREQAATPAPTPETAPVAEVEAAEEPKKVPFWKKEISLGGGAKRQKAPKPPKERKPKAPKVRAERAPKTKEPKRPKQPKERKAKAPKVKAARGGGSKRIVGLKIGASQLAAARVSNNGTAELQQVAREPLAPGIVVGGELRDPDALAAALKEFFTKHGLPKKGVRLGIANNRIGVRTFDIAGIEDPKQLANAVRFRAQEALPIPIDEAVLDYQVLAEGVDAEGQKTSRILLVVAYRELIDRYVDACKKAGIALVGIDLEAFALLRALQAPQDGVGADPSAALVAVAIGHERSTFAVSDGRVCEFTRVLEWGGSALNVAIARVLDAAPSEVEGAKRALALTDEMVPDGLTSDQAKKARDAMRRAIQTFARELVSSLQYYQNQPGSLGIGEIVLTGGTAHLPGLSGELERLIGVRVRVGDPLARMKVSKKVGEPEQLGSLAVAIGLGIDD